MSRGAAVKPELLAPAGSPECLEPAVRCGADAVYLGAARFSARGNAANFDRDALAQAVEYCHARGVRVYLALNTLLRDEELDDALALAKEACALPVDALIVQDLGLIRLLHACAPGLKLSASTQMSIHTPAGVRLCEQLGLGRVVLARELSACELRSISDESRAELEVFVHGALCMSVSGQCWFSAMLGGRSGNRGLCAQPCRLPFAAPGGSGHDLSLKDLSLIGRMDALAEAGATSVKIEGRMKRPEYVAAAVTACRCALDGTPEPEGLQDALRAVFSRSGFTQGYFDGTRGRAMFGTREKEDVEAASGAVLGQLHTLYRTERAAVAVQLHFSAQTGQPCTLTVCDGMHTVTVCGEVPQAARSAPLTEARAAQQLAKLGGTPLFAENVTCVLGEGLAVPASALNALRRAGADALLAARTHREPIAFDRAAANALLNASAPDDCADAQNWSAPGSAPGSVPLRLHFYDATQIPARLPENTELVYVRADTPPAMLDALQERGLPLALELPRGTFGTEPALRALLRRVRETGLRDAWCGTLNTLALAAEEGFTVHGGFSLNALNRVTLDALRGLGAADAELSLELTLAQMARLHPPLPAGMLIYGRVPLMLTRCCPIRNGTDCAHCDKKTALTDRRGILFPVRCAGGCSEVLNSVPLQMLDRQRELPPRAFSSMRFGVENLVEIEEILACYSAGKRPEGLFTRGLYEKGVF